MRYTSVIIFGLIMFAVGLKFEYHSDPAPVAEPVHFIPQTSNMLDKRNKECS